MTREMEEPTGYLLGTCPQEFKPGKIDEGVCHHFAFIARGSVAFPLNPRGLCAVPFRMQDAKRSVWEQQTLLADWIKYTMDDAQNVGKWKVVEIGRIWESPDIRLAKFLKHPRPRVHRCEVGKRFEGAHRGDSRESFQLLNDHRTPINNFDAAE